MVGVVADGYQVGVVRFGYRESLGLTAAACRWCGQARFADQLAGLEDAIGWLAGHLADIHGHHDSVVETATPRCQR